MNKQLLRDFVTTRPPSRPSEGNTKHRKEQPVPPTAKMYQIIKTNDVMKKLHQLMGKTTSQ